jgi:antitoxin MazE
MCSSVTRFGSGLAIEIPKAVADQLHLAAESTVDVTVDAGRIVISVQEAAPRYSLEELLAGITPENCHGEIWTDPPVGAELI